MFPVDTPLVLRLDKDAYGEKAIFLLNWSLIQSRSETARLLVCVVSKKTNHVGDETRQNGRGHLAI